MRACRRARSDRQQVSAGARAGPCWIGDRRRPTRTQLCHLARKELVEEAQHGRVVAVVVEILQAVTELRMPQMHHLLERRLQLIGKTGLSGGKLMRGTAKSGNRAEAVRSRIHWIGTAAVIADGELALNPPVTVRNDLPSARYDLVVEWFGHGDNPSKKKRIICVTPGRAVGYPAERVGFSSADYSRALRLGH